MCFTLFTEISKLDVLANGNDFQILSPNWGIAFALKRVSEEFGGTSPGSSLILKERPTSKIHYN